MKLIYLVLINVTYHFIVCFIFEQMSNLTKEEFVHVLRRQSTGFPRGSSKYRGVTLHKCGRWEARMGQFLGKKYHFPQFLISIKSGLYSAPNLCLILP